MDVFKKVIMEGFRLQNVEGVFLYKRRKEKRNLGEGRNNSIDFFNFNFSIGGGIQNSAFLLIFVRYLFSIFSIFYSFICSMGFVFKIFQDVNLDDFGQFDIFENSQSISILKFFLGDFDSGEKIFIFFFRGIKRVYSELLESVESDDGDNDDDIDDDEDEDGNDESVIVVFDDDLDGDGFYLNVKRFRVDIIVIFDD